jgi:hypothetical protein
VVHAQIAPLEVLRSLETIRAKDQVLRQVDPATSTT